MQYITGEQVKESIRRQATGWDPQESLVLKAAICGFHTEQRICSDNITCCSGKLDAENRDSRKAYGPPPRQQDLTGQRPPTTESKPTSPKESQKQQHDTEQQQQRQATEQQQKQQRPHPQPQTRCRQNNHHQHSDRIVAEAEAQGKRKTKRARGMASKPTVVPEQSVAPASSQTPMTWSSKS